MKEPQKGKRNNAIESCIYVNFTAFQAVKKSSQIDLGGELAA